jgi:hypothetical protein
MPCAINRFHVADPLAACAAGSAATGFTTGWGMGGDMGGGGGGGGWGGMPHMSMMPAGVLLTGCVEDAYCTGWLGVAVYSAAVCLCAYCHTGAACSAAPHHNDQC